MLFGLSLLPELGRCSLELLLNYFIALDLKNKQTNISSSLLPRQNRACIFNPGHLPYSRIGDTYAYLYLYKKICFSSASLIEYHGWNFGCSDYVQHPGVLHHHLCRIIWL